MFPGHVSPRRVNLTDLRLIGDELKRLTGADRYVVSLHGNTPRDVELAELPRLHPSERSFTIAATGTGPFGPQASTGEMTLTFSVIGHGPATVRGAGPGAEPAADNLRWWLGTLGQPVTSRAHRVPIGFFAVLALTFGPVVVLWSVGELSLLLLLPLVLLLLWTVIAVSSPLLKARVSLERQKSSSWLVDTRPIEDVELDQEQQRQRRQTGLRYALVSGTIVAVVAAVLAAVLRHYFP